MFYSAKEIDEMRGSVAFMLRVERGYGSDYGDHEATVERRLLTYMNNGTSPQELRDRAKERGEEWSRLEAQRVAAWKRLSAAQRAASGKMTA